MPQIVNPLKKLVPAVPGFLSGAATGAVLYLANHVLHLGIDETVISPLASVAVASGVHLIAKPARAVEVEAEKVATDPMVEYVTREIAAQLSASPTLKTKVVDAALGELRNVEAQSKLVRTIVLDAPKIEAAVAAVEPAPAPVPAPVAVAPAPAVAVAPVAAPAVVEAVTVPGPSATLPPSIQA